MSDKILTISVAAYNMELYIRELLDSVTSIPSADAVELFVCDDGGTDGTLEIAREYADRYPGTVIPLHKENGGYGSVLNMTVPMASGVYFKTLDGDDLMDPEGLEKLVSFLRDCTADWVLTKAEKFYEDGKRVPSPSKWTGLEGTMPIEETGDEHIGFWHINSCFRTKMLKEAFRPLPEHTLYTDLLYMAWPMPYVKTVAFLPETVYLYRAGRPGQSMNPGSKRKHFEEQIRVVKSVMRYYNEKNGPSLSSMARDRFYFSYKWLVLVLLILPPSFSNWKRIIENEAYARKYMRGFYDMGGRESSQICLLRRTAYLAYWPLALYYRRF